MDQRCCILLRIKQNCLRKTFLGTRILMTQDTYLPVFPSTTYLKQHNNPSNPKLVKKGHKQPWLSKASGPDWISVVVLRKSESKLSYIPSNLLHMCLKESCFPDCWKVSSVALVFTSVGERSNAKKTTILLVFFL